MKIVFRVLAALFCTLGLKLSAGNLKVNLAPAQAVSAGAQWRVDGGAWRASGATVSGLSNTTHTVDFKTVSNWIAPAAQSVTIGSGTTTLTGTYVQPAALKITLTPSSGQWRIDSGTWRASGSTVTGLTPGNHTIDYAAVSGYAAPAVETVTLSAGLTTTLTRNYTQLAQLKLTLTPATAQWRVDGGAWQASGATVSNLAVGSHAISYSALSGYTAPAAESVTLGAGQLLTLSRSYVQLARVSITLSPVSAQWRVDGGAWTASGATLSNLTPGTHSVTYSALSGYSSPAAESITLSAGQLLTLSRNYVQLAQVSITLSPGSAQWQVDGGPWMASGATVSNLTPGAHNVAYSTLSGWSSPANDTITLTAGQSLNFSRSYTQLAQLSIALTPSSGQWRANGGAWQSSGASLSVLPGAYTIEYSALPLYDSPANETVTLAAGGIFSALRSYTSQKPALRIHLGPAGQWRIDGGAWQNSGVQLTELNAGSHTLDYTDIGGIYDPLPSETISLVLRDNVTLDRAYPFKPSSLQVNLTPSTGTWRAYQNEYSSGWQPSGATITGLRYSSYNIEYSALANYDKPVTENVAISPAQSLTLDRSYAARAQVTVTLNHASGQWNIDGGAWQASGATVGNLTAGAHTLGYSSVTNYDAPTTETLTLATSQVVNLSRTYTPHPAQLTVTTTPANGQWRIYPDQTPPGGSWNASGATVTGVAPGTYAIEYAVLSGYEALAASSLVLAPGESKILSATYTAQLAQLSITLLPASAQWRIDGGAWQNSSATLTGLTLGTHTIEFSPVAGYATPASTTVNLVSGYNSVPAPAYVQLASFTVVLNPTQAQWRLDGGAWVNSSTYLSNLPLGAHTLEFSTIAGYVTPASRTVTLVSGSNSPSPLVTYTQLASLSVTLNPTNGQWRLDDGAWVISSSYLSNLPLGEHTLHFSPLAGYITPPAQTVTLVPGYNNPTIHAAYTQLASLSVTLNPTTAQWRLDGGAWLTSSTYLSNLSLGEHTVEFSTLPGYITPPSKTVTLVPGYNNPTISATYTPLASFSVTLNPTNAQWRLDGGAWLSSSTYLSNLSLGEHTVEFSTLAGYITPPSKTVTLVPGYNNPTLTATYTPLASFSVTLNPTNAQWRVDGGAWLSSSTYLSNLLPGQHTVEFSTLPGYITPPSKTVTLVPGYNNPTLTATYTQLASLGVTLFPASAQWRIDGGAWLSSSTYLSNLSLGAHTVEFSNVAGYTTPPPATITLVSGYNNPTLYRRYIQPGHLNIIVTPPWAQWRIDGGAWRDSSTSADDILPGTHTIEFSSVLGYTTPAPQTFSFISLAETPVVTATYTPLASFTVVIQDPSWAQWRLDGGGWQNSSNLLYNISPGNHTVEFSHVSGYLTPAPQTVTLGSGYNSSLTATYTPLASFSVMIQGAYWGQWRLDGGPWQNSANTLYYLPLGEHTVEFSDVSGYITPAAETVTLGSGYNSPLTATYTPLASFSATIQDAYWGQWRIDGGLWQNSANTLYYLSLGEHTVEFSHVSGYITPVAETVTLGSGYNPTVTGTYTPLASFTVTIQDAYSGQWRIDGGSWQNSDNTLYSLSLGEHTVEFSDVFGFTKPDAQTVTLVSGYNPPLTATYTPLASFSVILNTYGGQWRLDGGSWQDSSTTLYYLTPGEHFVEFSDLSGCITPAPEIVVLGNGYNSPLTAAYLQVF